MGDYRKLEVWQRSMELAVQVYEFTEKLPAREKFALSDQMRRAAVSIPSNLAEGSARRSDADFCRYVNIAYGSLMELETQVLLTQQLKLAREASCETLLALTAETGKMLNGLGRRLRASTKRRDTS